MQLLVTHQVWFNCLISCNHLNKACQTQSLTNRARVGSMVNSDIGVYRRYRSIISWAISDRYQIPWSAIIYRRSWVRYRSDIGLLLSSIIGLICRHIVNTLSIYAYWSWNWSSQVARGVVNSHCPLVWNVINLNSPPINNKMAMESALRTPGPCHVSHLTAHSDPAWPQSHNVLSKLKVRFHPSQTLLCVQAFTYAYGSPA